MICDSNISRIMRIAQVAPLYESVPPVQYGGTERVISYLTEALVAAGHDVTLFATGDSVTSARLMPICPRRLWSDPESKTGGAAEHLLLLERVFARAADFDVLHFHIDYHHFPLSRRTGIAQLTTLHGRLDLPELKPVFDEYAEMPLVSISTEQRRPLPGANWQCTVYHGLPDNLYRPAYEPGEYLVFLGRVSPEKGLDRAIRIARQAGLPLKVAAKVDPVDREYFERVVRPLLDDPLVDFLGQVDDQRKGELLRGARALLFPIDWPEPFGLVVIEALACGLPVIAWPRGSVPELIEDGVTGYLVDSEAGAAEASHRCATLDRRACRQMFERRFTARRMAADYVAAYHMLQQAAARPRVARATAVSTAAPARVSLAQGLQSPSSRVGG